MSVGLHEAVTDLKAVDARHVDVEQDEVWVSWGATRTASAARDQVNRIRNPERMSRVSLRTTGSSSTTNTTPLEVPGSVLGWRSGEAEV